MENNVYTRRDIVRSSACDGHCLLSDISVLQLVEDQITEFFGELGIDNIAVRGQYGAFWVFVKNRIELYRRPAWREAFTVSSRLGLRRAAKACVDTVARDEAGQPLFASRVEMCLLDGQSGSIMRLDDIGMTKDTSEDEIVPPLSFERFPKPETQLLEKVRVRTSNLDMSRHTNNVEYLRFIINTMSPAALDSEQLHGMELHYGAQSYADETLDIRTAPAENGRLYVIEREGKNILTCKMW